MRLGDPAGASETLDRALTVAESLNAPAEVAGVRCSQACLALELQEWERARVHAGEAIETSGLAHAMRRTTPQWVLGMVALSKATSSPLENSSRRAFPRRKSGAHPVTRRHSVGSGRGKDCRGAQWRGGELGKRALDLWRNLGDRWAWSIASSCWRTLAAGTEPEGAAELLGAAESLRDRAGAKATPREAAQVAAISGSLGQALAAVGLEAGAKMDETDAIAAAERIISRIEAVGPGDEDPNPVAETGNQ